MMVLGPVNFANRESELIESETGCGTAQRHSSQEISCPETFWEI
jgi:hypothetical protein